MTELQTSLCSPSDWPNRWKDMQTIDSLLRCSICGEFFKNTNFIPSCSHNYCSLCIRKYLNVESKCPTCGVAVQDTQLENNRIMDEIIKSFVNVRHDLLELVKKKSKSEKIQNVKKTPVSKKLVDRPKPAYATRLSHKRIRSCSSSSNEHWSPDIKCKKARRSRSHSSDSSEEVPIPQRNGSATKAKTNKRINLDTSSGKIEDSVPCPVCSQEIPKSRINFHLDSCLETKGKIDNLRLSVTRPVPEGVKTGCTLPAVGANQLIPKVTRRKPLNKLVYTLLSNTELKRKMKEHGLSIKGDRQSLVKRHQEFLIMYNSECGKARPKSVNEIVRLVEEGERKKSRHCNEARDGTKLNFNRAQTREEIEKTNRDYLKQNQSEFTRLINEIKNRKNQAEKSLAQEKKIDPTGSSNSNRKDGVGCIISDDETASNSSAADFEVTRTQYTTPRRRTPRQTGKRRTRSSFKGLQQIVEVDTSDDDLAVHAEGKDISVDPMMPVNIPHSPVLSFAHTIPDPPSPSLLQDLEKESSGDDIPMPVYCKCDTRLSPSQADNGNESEELIF